MNLLEYPAFGVIAGSIIASLIAGIFTLISQRFEARRQKKLFAHERDQKNIDRRMEALTDLFLRLEDQAEALRDLWDFIRNPIVLSTLKITPEEAWNILHRKNYRAAVWVIGDTPIITPVNDFVCKIGELLQVHLRRPAITQLMAREIDTLDQQVVDHLNQKFEETAKPLSVTLKEINILRSNLTKTRVLGSE